MLPEHQFPPLTSDCGRRSLFHSEEKTRLQKTQHFCESEANDPPTLKIRWDYRRSGSNRHIVRYAILSRARLPIPPRRQLKRTIYNARLLARNLKDQNIFLKIRSRRNEKPWLGDQRRELKKFPAICVHCEQCGQLFFIRGWEEIAPGGGRTHNLRLRRPALYPIELRVLNECESQTGDRKNQTTNAKLFRMGTIPQCNGHCLSRIALTQFPPWLRNY